MAADSGLELTDARLNVLRALLDGPKTRHELACYARDEHVGELVEGGYVEAGPHAPGAYALTERGLAAWVEHQRARAGAGPSGHTRG